MKLYLSFYVIACIIASMVAKGEEARTIWLVTAVYFGYKLVELNSRKK